MAEEVVKTWTRAKNGVQRIVSLVIFAVLIAIGLWIYYNNVIHIRKRQLLRSELESSVKCLLPLCGSRLSTAGVDLEMLETGNPEHQAMCTFLEELERIDETKYFFVLDKKGQSWANGGNPHISQRMSGTRPGISMFTVDPEMKKPVETMVSTAMQGGGVVEYDWVCPSKNNEKTKKISYVERIPDTGLILGRGVYI